MSDIRYFEWALTAPSAPSSSVLPRPLEEIEADIKALESEILVMLREVAG